MSDPSAAVAAAPLVAALTPYIDALVPVIITGIIGLVSAALHKWLGVRVNATYEAQIEAAAATEAGKLVAGAEGNLATATIPVGSPIVAAAAARILASDHLQDALSATGATPERVAAIVAGELGKLQAQMGVPAPSK
jgi:hypothetical protein